MKKFIKLIPAALALVALASCSNDDLFSKNGQIADGGQTMTATIEDYANVTRAAFAEGGTDGQNVTSRALIWTSGDAYHVYGELTQPDKWTLKSGDEGKSSADFTAVMDVENPKFAVFPFDKVTADRSNSKLNVTLGNWQYKTTDPADKETYNLGGFVADVPMYGTIDAESMAAKFYYMTALLRVDLKDVPKKSTRLIVVTDRPLTGEFTADLDESNPNKYPEIISPAENGSTKVTETFGTIPPYTNQYILEIGLESVAKRTNKTFFIPVPTGNKYGVFDVIVEYNMGNSKKYELLAQLGNTYRLGAGKSALKWERGKVKSMHKDITVTASGSTPKEIAAFLKDEWKTFPDGDINITVPAATGIDLSTVANNTFTVPAELKGRVINIIATDYDTPGAKMIIVDEDKAPVASAALRKINFIVPATNAIDVEIDAPETQIEFKVADPENETAVYANFTSVKVAEGDMATEAAGLTIAESVTQTGYIKLDDGSFLNEGKIWNLADNSNYDVICKGDANLLKSNKNGAIKVLGQLDDNGNIVTAVKDIEAYGNGDVYVEKIKEVNINQAAGTGVLFAGDVEISDVTSVGKVILRNPKNEGALSISKVADGIGTVSHDGLGAVTVDDVVLGTTSTIICADNDDNNSDFTVTNLKVAKDLTATQTIPDVKYRGNGNVTVSGAVNNKDVYPTVTNIIVQKVTDPTKHGAGNVTITDVNITGIGASKGLVKESKGTLTITGVHEAFGDLANYEGNVTITGDNANGADINSLTQKGAGAITLKELSKGSGTAPVPARLKTLTINDNDGANSVTYENTFISTVSNNRGATKSKVNFKGTKSSGMGSAAGGNTYETDTWTGTDYARFASSNIYTSGQLAAMAKPGLANPTETMIINIDLGGHAYGGIVPAVTNLVGSSKKISNLNGTLFQNHTSTDGTLGVANLTLETVKAKNAAIMAKSEKAVTATSLTIKDVTLSATNNAGGILGIAEAGVTLTSCTVENITISSTDAGLGTDINLGGFIGQVNNSADNFLIRGGLVKGATISGHYYMGGFIGQVIDAKNVRIVDKTGGKTDKTGSQVQNFTFNVITKDDNWSTLKCGTVAPFIGGINKLGTSSTDVLQIYGGFTEADFTRTTCSTYKWDKNFLSNEAFKFIGTKEMNCNFIGYINVANAPAFTYYLKHVNGFEANPSMTIITTTDTGKTADTILATDCNVYASDIY